MSWRQALNISAGYQKKQKADFEKHAVIHRNLQAMVYNFMVPKNGKKMTPQEIFPLDIDKGVRQAKKQGLPFETFKKIFYATFSTKNDQ